MNVVMVKEDEKVLMTERGRDRKPAGEVSGRPLAAMDGTRPASEGRVEGERCQTATGTG